MEYLLADGIAVDLDFHTDAKLRFITELENAVLAPHGLRYRMQFPGPTGTNFVEAAIKLARRVTGRRTIVAFSNAFHGRFDALATVTRSALCGTSAEGLLIGIHRLPFEGYLGAGESDLLRFPHMTLDALGGIDPVAAIPVETVQREGGLNVASNEWLQTLSNVAKTSALSSSSTTSWRAAANRAILQLRAGEHSSGYCLSGEVDQWIRATDVADVDETGARRLEHRRAQRHVQRKFARVRDRSGSSGPLDSGFWAADRSNRSYS